MKDLFVRKDITLLIALAVTITIGIVMLSSASSVLGFQRFGDSYFFVKKQITYGVLPGLVGMAVVMRMGPSILRQIAPWVYALTLVLLVLVFVPSIGEHLDRASRWINIGGFLLQPSEIAKLASILFAARWLSVRTPDELSRWKEGIAPYLGFVAVTGGLVILEPDLGTTLVIVTTLTSLLFFAGVRLKTFGVIISAGILLVMTLIVASPYRFERLKTFFDHSADTQGASYHVNQALVGVSSGGWFGRGLGRSVQKLQYLPEVTSDSLFAIMAEELGFFMLVPIILLLFWIIRRCLYTAEHASDRFQQLVCAGVGMWLAVQTTINISANVGLVPFTGVPLPFLSHGGTSMMMVMAGVTIVFMCSHASAQAPSRLRARIAHEI